jgi:putative transposase
VTVAARRAAVAEARSRHPEVSERQACRVIGCALSSQRYRSRRDPRPALRSRLRELAHERVRFGYRRLHVLLVREGIVANKKCVYRLYREEGLAVRKNKRKRVAVARQSIPAPTRVNEGWGMDFMSDVLRGGRRFRVLNVLDVMSRVGLASEVDTSLPARRVVQTLDEIALDRGYPRWIVVDNGPEFRSVALDAWAHEHGVLLDFIDPGKPMQNAIVESYNGRMRDECLNVNWWTTIEDARRGIDAHRIDYNEVRPHGSLNDRTPIEFARELKERDSELRVA